MNQNLCETTKPSEPAVPGRDHQSEKDVPASFRQWIVRYVGPLITGLLMLMLMFWWGIYQLFDPIDAGLIIAGTLLCLFFAGGIMIIWWCGNRIERYFGLNHRKVENHTKPKPTSDGSGCMVFIIILTLSGAIRPILHHSMQPLHPITPQFDTDDSGPILYLGSPHAGNFRRWIHNRDATLAYWQTAVANLHQIRFKIPSGQESAEKYYEEMVQQLRLLTEAARSASTVNVDFDLVQMATRHLTVENQFLQLMKKVDEFMRRESLSPPTDTIDQRMELTQQLFGLIQINPEIMDNLPPGPERDFIESALELEQQRLEQLREIEIMQAVLQERYKGMKFPLPEIEQ